MFPYSDVFSYNWKSQYNSHTVCDTGRALIVKTYFYHPLFFFVFWGHFFFALKDFQNKKYKKNGSDHGLAPTRLLQAITLTNAGSSYWHIYASHSLNEWNKSHIKAESGKFSSCQYTEQLLSNPINSLPDTNQCTGTCFPRNHPFLSWLWSCTWCMNISMVHQCSLQL